MATFGRRRVQDHTIAMRDQHHWPWVELMWAALFEAMGLAWRTPPEFKPTVDIDVAFKHLGRSRWKSNLLQVRDVVMGRWGLVAERRKVHSGRLSDPYDTYAFFNGVHRDDPLCWFVLASDRRLPFDVGLDPEREVLPALVANLASAHEGTGGWHPGYAAVNDEAVRAHERQRISTWSGIDMSTIRTHFLRGKQGRGGVFWNPWALKKTCRSVGPETWDLGQASAARSKLMTLRKSVHCTCAFIRWRSWMWGSGTCGVRREARGALTLQMAVVSDVGGHWMSCWHNTSVSEEEPWQGWRATYLHMVDAARHWG